MSEKKRKIFTGAQKAKIGQLNMELDWLKKKSGISL